MSEDPVSESVTKSQNSLGWEGEIQDREEPPGGPDFSFDDFLGVCEGAAKLEEERKCVCVCVCAFHKGGGCPGALPGVLG